MMKKYNKLKFPVVGLWKGKKTVETTEIDQKEIERNLTQAIIELTRLCESLSSMTVVNQIGHYHSAGSISIENIEKIEESDGKE